MTDKAAIDTFRAQLSNHWSIFFSIILAVSGILRGGKKINSLLPSLFHVFFIVLVFYLSIFKFHLENRFGRRHDQFNVLIKVKFCVPDGREG